MTPLDSANPMRRTAVDLTSQDPSIGNADISTGTQAGNGHGIGIETGIGTETMIGIVIGTISTPMTFLPHLTALRPTALHPAAPHPTPSALLNRDPWFCYSADCFALDHCFTGALSRQALINRQFNSSSPRASCLGEFFFHARRNPITIFARVDVFTLLPLRTDYNSPVQPYKSVAAMRYFHIREQAQNLFKVMPQVTERQDL
jgi:hypothetical protein